jgi:hypothetical protein
MQTDYPELRAYLNTIDYFPTVMKKSPWLCSIKDNEALTAVQILEWNNVIQPSYIFFKREDGSYEDFWNECAVNEKNIPYDIRLASYSHFYIVY